jgi:hypothetical protein
MKPPTSSAGSSADVGSPGKLPLRKAIGDTRQQICDSVGDFAKGVNEAAKHITKAATGGGTDDDHDSDAPDE